MLVQLAVHIFVLVALIFNSLLYNFLIIILKFSIIKKRRAGAAPHWPRRVGSLNAPKWVCGKKKSDILSGSVACVKKQP